MKKSNKDGFINSQEKNWYETFLNLFAPLIGSYPIQRPQGGILITQDDNGEFIDALILSFDCSVSPSFC